MNFTLGDDRVLQPLHDLKYMCLPGCAPAAFQFVPPPANDAPPDRDPRPAGSCA
jgi:hypothetical protein